MQHTVQQKVRAVGQRARWLVRWQGLSRWAIVVVLVVLAACLLDWALRFQEHGVRWIVSAAVLGATLWAAWRWLLPAARFGPSDLEVAQWMERCAPEFQNRLSSAIAFLDQPADDPLAGSAELRRAVVAEAEVQVASYDAARCLDNSGPRRAMLAWLAVGLLAGGLVATDFAWFWFRQQGFQSWPSSALALARLAAPWSQLEWPRWNMLQFKRGPELLALGGDFEAEVVDQRGHLPDVVEIEYWFEGDGPDQVQRKLMKPMPDGAMLHRLENVTRPFRYRAVGGDHRHMAWTNLRLVEPPRVAAHQLVLHPPEYTGLPSGGSGPRIEALVGTRIAVRGTTTRPVRQVRLRVDQDPRASRIPVRVGEDGRSFTIAVEDDWVVRESGSYWFELRDEQGLTGGDEKKWEIRATQDQPPAVSLETPAGNLFVTPQSQPLIKAVAKDDLAVQRVELRYLRSDETQGGEQAVNLLEGPAEPAPRSAPEMSGDKQLVELRWDLTQLAGLEPGDWLDLHVAASDYRPQWGQSSTRRLTLISRDELDERLAQKQAQILAQLGDVLRSQTTARSQTRSLEIQLDEAGRFEKRDLDQLQGSELNQRQIQHALSGASDGVPARIRQLVEELESNRVDSPEVLRHMNELSARIAQLNRDTLPGIQQGLVEALKAARQRLEENPGEAAADRATAEPLQRAGQGQDQVIAALEEMLGELTQWDNYRRFAREVSRLQREQQEVRRDTDQLRLDTLTKELPDLTPQEIADLKRLAQRQVELARQLDKVQGRMQEMQSELQPADPLAAETLGDALDTARRLALSGQMRESGRSIESNRVGQAAQQQEQIAEGLEELLDVLANRRVHELDRLLNQLQRSAEDLAQLRQDQAGVRDQLAGAEQNPDPAARQSQLSQQAAAEQQLAERTAELARRLERLQAPESGQSAAAAAERQQAAAEAARQADGAAARQHADDASQKLATAQRQLEERLRQLEQDLFEEQLARLEQLVTGLISRQSALRDATVQLHQSQQAQSGQLTRPQLAMLGDLATQQRTLAAETEELAGKLGQARAFALALEGVLRDMARAARGLDRHDPGLDTQQAESSALARLQLLALALKQDEPSPPEEDPPAEQPAGQPMPAEDAAGLLAELKLIKLMQQQLLERTSELEAIRDGGRTWTREQELEATELAAEQGQLAALVLELLNPKDP